MQDYRKLKVWSRSRELITKVYRISEKLPESEKFGLISQLRRASISVAANIAEGSARITSKEFRHFVSISIGSISEVECYFLLIKDLGFLKNSDLNKLLEEVVSIRKMLISFRSKL